MAPQRKREARENQFYDLGVQGRKTGITLADRGIYDEHGLEPISGIFSSPEKSPPKRGGTVTASESMDIQESSIPDLTTSHQILRSARTHLPPPRSQSPKKTALGSSPRRQSSMVPRATSMNASSPPPDFARSAVARRLDFEQEDSSLQETPALSGSGQRRGKRASIYDIPEDASPVPHTSTILEESIVQEELGANDDSVIINGEAEESFAGQVGDASVLDIDTAASPVEEDSELVPQPVKQAGKKGRKRKSDVLGPSQNDAPATNKSRSRTTNQTQAANNSKTSKHVAPAPAPARRSKRVSDMTEQEPSVLDASFDQPADSPQLIEEPPVAPKRRGRPPRAKPDQEKENEASTKTSIASKSKEQNEPAFKKPAKPAPKSKAKPASSNSKSVTPTGSNLSSQAADTGKLVDVTGKPLSRKDIEQMSTASTGSRYGRGRHLSVYREMDPDQVAKVGRTGRHRVAPVDFWKNDRISYDHDGSMTSIVRNEDQESPRKQYKSVGRPKGKKQRLSVVEEDVELEPWEEDEGMLAGNFRDFDPESHNTTGEVITDTIAWANKGIHPKDVPDGSFKYVKLAAAGEFFNWGIIDLEADQMKRTKNSRRMHMVFNVQHGAVEVKVHENEFTVHKGGVWQVPRGNTYSIRNVGSGTARIFFAQAAEIVVQPESEE